MEAQGSQRPYFSPQRPRTEGRDLGEAGRGRRRGGKRQRGEEGMKDGS